MPGGPTKGSSLNHIGFSVPNLRQVVDKIKANGYRMVTAEEAPAGVTVKDVANAFLNHKKALLDAGELSVHTWDNYKQLDDFTLGNVVSQVMDVFEKSDV